MIGFSRATFQSVPKKPIGPTADIIAELAGESVANIRTVSGMTVTNNKGYPIWVEIEQESNKVPVSATVQPGATVFIPIVPIQTYWNATRRIPDWDGLNIRWKEPA